jgi:hypothetical protein
MTFPSMPMDRLLREACASFSLRHPGEDPVNPATSEWPVVYRAVHSHLRHAYSAYDQDLSASSGDPVLRERLRSEIESAAARSYPWLRLGRDPRTQAPTPGRPRGLILSEMSSHLSDLVTQRAQLVVALGEYRRRAREHRAYIDTLKERLREVEDAIREAVGYFNASKGVTEKGATLLYFGRVDGARCYLFGGRPDLAESYTKCAGFKMPPMRSQRPADQTRPRSRPVRRPKARLRPSSLVPGPFPGAGEEVQLPKTAPLRRSQLARRDWRPEPAITPEIRRPWFQPVVSVAKRVIPIGALALSVAAVAAMWAGTRWINEHSSRGTMLEPETILEVQERAFFQLPPLSPPWHWAMLPCSLATDDHGRPSFFIRARTRGTVKSQSDLPNDAQIGDQYTLANGTTSWVWMTPYGAKSASWVDP